MPTPKWLQSLEDLVEGVNTVTASASGISATETFTATGQ